MGTPANGIASKSGSGSAAPTAQPRFFRVAQECQLPVGTIQDEGATILLDGEGNSDAPNTKGKVSVKRIACVLDALETPAAVTAQIEQTRAMDGRQTAEADGVSYSWTYHPDDGLDLILADSTVGASD